jgi:hypothetical protein
MGDTIWVDVRDRREGDLPRDCSIMLRLERQLDRLCARLNVPRLSAFYDYSELEAAYGDFEGEDDRGGEAEGGSARGGWHDPTPALAAVRALHAHLQERPEDLQFRPDPSRTHWPQLLMEELADCLSELEGAAARGQQFRLLIVP